MKDDIKGAFCNNIWLEKTDYVTKEQHLYHQHYRFMTLYQNVDIIDLGTKWFDSQTLTLE